MNTVAVLIFVVMVVYVLVLYPLGRLSLAAVAVFLGSPILAVCAIPNLTHITHLILKAGEYLTVSVDAQQAAIETHNDLTEVRQMKDQIQKLASEVKQAESRIAQSEQSVSRMRAGIRQAYKALFDTVVIIVDTRNQLGSLPQNVFDELNRSLGVLATFTFANQSEVTAEVVRINGLVGFKPTPTMTMKSTPAPRPN